MTRLELISTLIQTEALCRKARADVEFAAAEPFITSAHRAMQSAKQRLDLAIAAIYNLDEGLVNDSCHIVREVRQQ